MLSKWQPKRKSFDLFSTCPKLHHTRTAAHNHAFKAAAFRLAASLHKHLEAHCSLSHDTSLSQTGLAFEFVPSDSPLQLYSSQAGNSRLQTLQHYRWVLEDGNLILGQIGVEYPTSIRKLLSGQYDAYHLIHTLKNWSKPMVKSYRHKNLLEKHFKNILPSDGPSMDHGR